MSLSYAADVQYAQNRCLGTVILSPEKRLIMVDGYEDRRFICRDLLSKKVLVLTAKELNLSPIQLGYCDHGGNSYYISRAPMRGDWRQGLRPRNLRQNVSAHFSLGLNVLCQSHYERYSTLEDSLEELFNEEVQSKSLSRNFAISRGRLWHKSTKVGSVDIKKGKVVLSKKFFFLQEALDEVIPKV